MAVTAIQHDHFVLLLETPEFENLPAWLSENFNVIEGGTHAGGSSRNKLVVFKDGTYLELFNWIEKPVEFLAWAKKPPGLIDFALTTDTKLSPEENIDSIQGRLSKIPADLNLGVKYSEPNAGGRKRADGTEVKWKTSRPSFSTTDSTPDVAFFPNGRIDVPFFCHDVTARTVRVPFDNEQITTHPCGAVGVDGVEVIVPKSYLDAYSELYGAVLGVSEPDWITVHNGEKVANYEIGVPHPLDDMPAYVQLFPIEGDTPASTITASDDQSSRQAEDQVFLNKRGIGIRGLVLKTAQSSANRNNIVSLSDDEIGRTIKLRR